MPPADRLNLSEPRSHSASPTANSFFDSQVPKTSLSRISSTSACCPRAAPMQPSPTRSLWQPTPPSTNSSPSSSYSRESKSAAPTSSASCNPSRLTPPTTASPTSSTPASTQSQ